MKHTQVLLAAAFLTLAIAQNSFSDATNIPNPTEKKISMMAYNVENLFDNLHDEGKDDWEYTSMEFKKNSPEAQKWYKESAQDPKACLALDWNDRVLNEKLNRIADTILAARKGGPDVVILAEVENLNVLKMLTDGPLKNAGYKTVVLIEGDDRRGIDVGMLSKLPLAEPARLHRIEFTPDPNVPNWKTPLTRGILEVPLNIGSAKILRVFGVHFPSQAKPFQQRLDGFNTLLKLMKDKSDTSYVVAGGDTNITKEEGEANQVFEKIVGKYFQTSHLLGCKEDKGSHFYRGSWSFLDALMFNEKQTLAGSTFSVDASSIKVVKNGKYQLAPNGTPARFDDGKKEIGVSDHLGMSMDLKIQ